MDAVKDRASWMALSHLPNWDAARINGLLLEITTRRRLSFEEFFEMEPMDWQDAFELNPSECSVLVEAKSSLPELCTLAAELLEQGFEFIPIFSEDYSKILKKNLTLEHSPPLLYTRGNKRLLHESTVALIGAAQPSDAELHFSDAVVKRCSEERRVVVSGLAKGVDRAAFDAALKYHGRSVMVLQQGVRTIGSGLKQYESRIADGDLLALSPFPPKISSSSSSATAKGRYAHGLAEEIYVAGCDPNDETFSQIEHGLKKGRRVYVRIGEPDEESASDLLVWEGAVPVDGEGNILPRKTLVPRAPLKQLSFSGLKEEFESKIRRYLWDIDRPASAREIGKDLEIKMEPKELSRLLKDLEFIETTKAKGGSLQFKMKSSNRKLRR